MMTAYILKLILLVPMVGGLAFAALWLWRKLQPGLALGQREGRVRLLDAVRLGATGRLAGVDLADKRLLISFWRGRIDLLSEAAIPGITAGD